MPEDPRLRRPPVVLAAALFLLGLLVLVSPVSTSLPRDDEVRPRGGATSRSCGVVVTEAFATAGPRLRDADRDAALDCSAQARGRLGFGVLLLLLAVPPAFVAVLTPGERAGSGG